VDEKIITYKGTDKDMKCRGFQYEIGKKVESDGAIRCGGKGFHSCEVPMDVFSYYSPTSGNRFFKCEASGRADKEKGADSKIASSELELKTEIGISGIVKAQIDFVKKSAKTNTAQGDYGYAAAQGYGGHAAAQGGRGHAAAQGAYGRAEVHGQDAIAAAFGINGAVLGELDDWLVCAEWENLDGCWHIVSVKAAKVDGKKIKPNVWYKLSNGEFVKADGPDT
jgi:hypothetical protein